MYVKFKTPYPFWVSAALRQTNHAANIQCLFSLFLNPQSREGRPLQSDLMIVVAS